ncbi:cell division protein PerM [Rhodococcus sp. BE178]|uniref:cell division protein PerM n=1 Tax=Rhodococcus sp. BE178 TaxID=2817737 RepID=UPI003D1FB041
MTSLLGRGVRRDISDRPDPDTDQVRALLGVALRPTGVAIVLISAVVIVTLVASNSDLTGAVGAIAACWLALHQVSLTITDAPLGVLPLLPTAVMMWAVARGCARAVTARSTLRDAARVVAAAVAGPFVMTLIALAVVTDATSVVALEAPNAAEALAWVVGIHLVVAVAGVVATTGRAECERRGAPSWGPEVARPAARAALALFAVGSAVTVASLVWSWSDVGTLLGDGSDPVGVLGLTVLSVLYLPNVAVGAVAVLVGGTAHAGGTSVSVFDIVAGPVPPVPVLGGVPGELVGTAWPVLLIVPLAIGALLGRDCGRLRLPVQETAYTVGCAAAGVGVVAAAVGFVAGGELGAYGFVGVEPLALGLITFGFLALPGLAVATLIARRNGVESDGGDETERTEKSDKFAETAAFEDTGADDPALAFEVKRLALPSMRYRSEPEAGTDADAESGPESEPGSAAGPAAPDTSDGSGETVLEGELVDDSAAGPTDVADTDVIDVEVEAVPQDQDEPGEPESSPGTDETETTSDEAAEAAEGDLPDGPLTPSD